MKNAFLQFLNRQRLAISLSRSDLLREFDETGIFRHYKAAASLFRRRSADTIVDRIRDFLRRENDEVLTVLADEIWSRCNTENPPLCPAPDTFLPSGSCCLCRSMSEKKRDFYRRWLKELPAPAADIAAVCARRWNLRRDMRLYAADWQEISELVKTTESGFCWEVDWPRTSADCLWVVNAEQVRVTTLLNPEEQRHLAQLWGNLFFEKNCFIASWSGVAVDSLRRVMWTDFDALYPADSDLQNFAAAFLKNGVLPKRASEIKLAAALHRLRFFVPDINLFDIWKTWLESGYGRRQITQMTAVPSFQSALRRSGMDFLIREPAKSKQPEEIRYLLDSSRHRKDPRFRKSSIFYWLPLVIAIYILLRYF